MTNRGPARPKNTERKSGRQAQNASLPAVVALVCAVALVAGLLSGFSGGAADVAESLRLSEIMTSNGSTVLFSDGALPDWIEIENISNADVDLTGWALVSQAKPSNAFAFPSGTLKAGERVVICCDNQGKSVIDGQYHAPFKLSASGATVALLDKRGNTADVATTPALARDQVYCRDANGEWQVSGSPTPGKANQISTPDAEEEGGGTIQVVPGPVEISEVMSRNVTFFPDENGEYADYVEVRNTTGQSINLEGWALSDNRGKLLRWTFPSVTLPGGGCLAVHCSGVDKKDDPKHLHANFKLNRDGEELFLTDPRGVTTSMVKVPALEADVAYSHIETGWTRTLAPSPNYANDQTGADAAAESIRGGNGRGVYITELLASSNKSDDWVEIYNASTQAVDLSGCGLSDNAARPRKWQFPSGTVIQPGAYLGVFCNGQDSSADGKLSTGFRLSADGGYSVTLSEPDGAIFDRLYVPMQYQNIAFGRPDTLTGVRYFMEPTPGAANAGQMFYGRAPQPTYSVYGGLYHTGDTLTVEMSVPSNCRIYYTLDCTDPTQSSTPYTGPISVTGTTILRTRVYGEGYMESVMDAQSYLYDVNNADGTLFVMSLVSDPYNLTSDEAGIMVKGPNALPNYPYGSRDFGPYVQSERQEKGIYLEYAKKLIEKGEAYYCFCTKERLEGLKRTVEGKEIMTYDKHCLHLSKEEIEEKLNEGVPYVIRQNNPVEGTTTFTDILYGDITVDNAELDDMVLIKSDGYPTYNFANVVDDHLMGITHVVRGNEYLSSSPKYTRLYQAFGWEEPKYIHCPLITDMNHEKLSKRSGASSFEDLIEQGFLTDTVVNFVALLGWSPEGENEIMSLPELVEKFDFNRINKSPAVFDMTKLSWMNGEYIKKLPVDRFYELAEPYLREAVKSDIDLKKVAVMVQTRIERFTDIAGLTDFMDQVPSYDVSLYSHKKMKTDPDNSLSLLKEVLPVLSGDRKSVV